MTKVPPLALPVGYAKNPDSRIQAAKTGCVALFEALKLE